VARNDPGDPPSGDCAEGKGGGEANDGGAMVVVWSRLIFSKLSGNFSLVFKIKINIKKFAKTYE
jgi:hypothetical protein